MVETEYPADYEDSDDHTESDANQNEIVLSYLMCPRDAAGAFRGALMLTDARVRPLHFAFVSPIRPTKIQRILYGSTLDEHVSVDVIAKKLLADLPVVPDVLLVDTQDLIVVRRIADMPTAFLRRVAGDVAGSLSSLHYDTGANVDDQETVGQILASLEMQVDLVEPFERMREALKEAIKSGDSVGE
jgi:hypothetical protein